MKKVLICLLAFTAISYAAKEAEAVVYEASSLHNAVGRSETVQDLFFDRWSSIVEREQYFDIYGKINWIPGFKIRTVDRSTGEKKTVDMRLVRTYGSVTVSYPILGGYDKTSVKNRLSKGSRKTEKPDASATEQKDDGGIIKKQSLVLGFTATGFHYGLTRATKIDRGTAGTETATDYAFTQFFDDIFAVSLLYQPYFYVHGGVIMQNQIDPNPDGTMSYGSSKDGFPKYRYFFASNLFSFLNANATSSKGKLEKIGASVEIKSAAAKIYENIPALVPKFTIGYKQLNAYNDEGYEAVWVRSATTTSGIAKNGFMDDSMKEKAKLHTLSFLVSEDISNILFFDGFIEYQKSNAKLIEKRTGKTLNMPYTREIRGTAGINILGFDKTNASSMIFSFGLGRYWDPGISVQRKSGTGNRITGWIFDAKFDNPLFGADVMVNYNYSQELRKLIEATDKFAIECSAFFRI